MVNVVKNSMEEPIAVTCDECKSELEYTYKDIQREIEGGLFGLQYRVKRYIVCPVCKSNVYIDKTEVEVKGEENEK